MDDLGCPRAYPFSLPQEACPFHPHFPHLEVLLQTHGVISRLLLSRSADLLKSYGESMDEWPPALLFLTRAPSRTCFSVHLPLCPSLVTAPG